MAGMRRRGRAYALQVLYGMDLSHADAADATSAVKEQFELTVEPEAEKFAHGLVDQVSREREAVDGAIQEASRNWRLERMGAVDRNILRIATAELLFSGEVPTRVIINEAIELAKRFGASESAAFVNGILDRVAAQCRGGNAQG